MYEPKFWTCVSVAGGEAAAANSVITHGVTVAKVSHDPTKPS